MAMCWTPRIGELAFWLLPNGMESKLVCWDLDGMGQHYFSHHHMDKAGLSLLASLCFPIFGFPYF